MNFSEPLLAWVRHFRTGEPLSLIGLSRRVFGCPVRPDIMHQVVVWHRAGLRAGTACTKSRGEVRGSNRKLRPQKGTGRARIGAGKAPHHRGGGVAFGPKPKSWAFHLPSKILSLGLRSALSAKYLQNQLQIVDSKTFSLDSHKTRGLASVLENHYSNRILFIDTQSRRNFILASGSLPGVSFMSTADEVNAYHLLKGGLVILTTRALAHFETTLQEQ